MVVTWGEWGTRMRMVAARWEDGARMTEMVGTGGEMGGVRVRGWGGWREPHAGSVTGGWGKGCGSCEW
jgi:hypothetical protein